MPPHLFPAPCVPGLIRTNPHPTLTSTRAVTSAISTVAAVCLAPGTSRTSWPVRRLQGVPPRFRRSATWCRVGTGSRRGGEGVVWRQACFFKVVVVWQAGGAHAWLKARQRAHPQTHKLVLNASPHTRAAAAARSKAHFQPLPGPAVLRGSCRYLWGPDVRSAAAAWIARGGTRCAACSSLLDQQLPAPSLLQHACCLPRCRCC